MKKKFFLKKGDIIDVVAPASACDMSLVQAGVHWLKDHGYQPRISKKIFNPDMYLAHSDEFRSQDLLRALKAKDSKAVWCVRGGYGSIRLLPYLKNQKISQNKLFIGLSDITVLHQWLNQQGWITVHGPILARSLGVPGLKETKEIFDILENRVSFIDFKKIKPLNKAAKMLKSKKMSKILGGNLTTICSLLGTPYQIQSKGCFLFFEDIAERGYKVDRMLQQLRLAGVFKGCKGVFFGDFVQSDESNGKNYVWPTIKAFFQDENIPVFGGVESDHSENQRPLFLNSKAELIFDKKYILRVYNK